MLDYPMLCSRVDRRPAAGIDSSHARSEDDFARFVLILSEEMNCQIGAIEGSMKINL